MAFQLLAYAVLILHAGVVTFIVGGLVLVFVGNLRHWRWVNSFTFRLAHLGAIVFVVAESWLEINCPLNSLEMWLRAQAHATTYGASFIEYWLHRLLYYQAPAWLFALGYSLFGLLVVAAWCRFPPPRKPGRKERNSSQAGDRR